MRYTARQKKHQSINDWIYDRHGYHSEWRYLEYLHQTNTKFARIGYNREKLPHSKHLSLSNKRP